MSVAIELDVLRKTIPGCSLVIFGDLFSQITLCVSSSRKYRQEQLDSFCASASNLLDGEVANSVARVLGVPRGASLSQAVIIQSDEMQVFLRSPFEDVDVLCCIGPMDMEVSGISAQAGRTFQKIGEIL